MPNHYRIAVLADIHGNMQALEAVLADLENDNPLDGILVAGDIIAGPGQQQVLQQLLELNAVMIQGNNEQRIARMATGTVPSYYYTAKQFSLMRWVYEHLDPDQRTLICNLPEQTVFRLPGADAIRMAHGSPRNVSEGVAPESCYPALQKLFKIYPKPSPNLMNEIFALVEEPVLILGHVHLPWCEKRDGRFVMNPGALDVPYDGWVGAQYAMLHWDGCQWTPEFRAVRYDMEAFKHANQASGILSSGLLARIFMEEAVQGRDISTDFFLLANHIAAEAGYDSLSYYPDEVWEQAEREFQIPERTESTCQT